MSAGGRRRNTDFRKVAVRYSVVITVWVVRRDLPVLVFRAVIPTFPFPWGSCLNVVHVPECRNTACLAVAVHCAVVAAVGRTVACGWRVLFLLASHGRHHEIIIRRIIVDLL